MRAVVLTLIVLCSLLLVASIQFLPMMDIEKRRREGLPYDDLLEKKPPGKLVWAALILIPIIFVVLLRLLDD